MARVGSGGDVSESGENGESGDHGDGDGDKRDVKPVWTESTEPAVFSGEVSFIVCIYFCLL